jgi:peptidoglycan/LPS O-acetylase OafA/YrhL
MVKENNSRSFLLDFLKGIAIIAVILYHSGLFTYGYLGVEIFLVVGGYLTTKGILHSYDRGDFSYWNFFVKRLIRLWPLVLLVSLFAFVCGYFWMLPDNFKNTCETVVGTSSFFNNFVQFITSSDYWDASNDFKPLMHTWYIGLMFQFYVFYPILFMVCHAFTKNWKKTVLWMLIIVFVCSLLLYVLPCLSDANKFYLLPARLFEFAAGGLIAVVCDRESTDGNSKQLYGLLISSLILIILLSFNTNLDAKQYRLLLTVGFVSFLVVESTHKNEYLSKFRIPFITTLGMASYSLYLWHQPMLAFYRYVVNDKFTIWSYLIVLSISIVAGLLSYYYIEQPISKHVVTKKLKTILLSACFLSAALLIFISAYYYKRHGIVRDVPELGISINNTDFECQTYNERNFAYDKDFPKNGKKNILVLGDSFGRDWVNILRESGIDSIMNISYHKDSDNIVQKRIDAADYIFVAENGAFGMFYKYLPAMMSKCFYRVGHKRFGTCNGVYYNHRHDTDYYSQTFAYDTKLNKEEQQIFKDHYIDLMSLIVLKNGRYPVFTPDHKFYSHDGIHLTEDGAHNFARLIHVRHLLY